MRAENIGDQFLIGWPIEHVTPVPVGDPQHFRAIVVITPALAPQIRRLQRRHQHRDMARAHLLFMNDVLQLAQNLETKRQPGINPRRRLLDHPRPQHQPMRGNLRLGRGFLENGQKVTAQTHIRPLVMGHLLSFMALNHARQVRIGPFLRSAP